MTGGADADRLLLADERFTVQIDDGLGKAVKAAVAADGVPAEVFVRTMLASHYRADVERSVDPDPAIDERIANETLRRGDGVPW